VIWTFLNFKRAAGAQVNVQSGKIGSLDISTGFGAPIAISCENFPAPSAGGR
jgi:hypothetical protein